MGTARMQGAPCGKQSKHMVQDKLGSVVPNNRIVSVFDLVGKKEEGNASRLWLVLKHAVFVGLGHGILSPESRIDHRLEDVASFPAEIGYKKATARVYANVAGQNITIRLIFKQGVKML